LEAIQWAAVAPTFPEPTTLTLLRMIFLSKNQFTTEDTESTGEVKDLVSIC
jgi:hypothetical protein